MDLFKRGKIGDVKLKNRIIMAPMGTKPEANGSYSDHSITYFEERAKGGAGLIITGANIVSTKYEARPENELSEFHNVEKLAVMIERCHHYGAKVFVQLTPGLGRMVYADPYTPPYSASDTAHSFWFPNLKCRALTIEDIQFLEERMAYSAGLAKAAGADGVEIHGYGGYLIDQFNSSLWNQRKDQYGGSLENRLRFSTEIIAKIKETCGSEFPVSMKFTAYHGIKGGRELDKGVKMAQIYEAAGVDALHVDVGCYEVWYKAITTVYEKPMHQIFAAKAVKQAVNIPVITQGKLNNPKDAEQVLEDGNADFVGLAHQMLADPYWPAKVKAGNFDRIVPCIGCNECLLSGFNGKHYYCTVNPLCYAEKDYQLTPAKTTKKILVIGGGPGGMEAAITAARRGYQVELWEKTTRLGGNMYVAGYPAFKRDVMKFVKYLEREVSRQDINVRYDTVATEDKVLAGHFDKVILATGAKSKTPHIAGIENASQAEDYLVERKTPGQHVVVIGGGLVGCETALDMSAQSDDVTIVEMLDDILLTADHSKNNDLSLRDHLTAAGVKIMTGAKIKTITDSSITLSVAGKDTTLPCDTAIIAAGYSSVDDLEGPLADKVDLTVVGDAEKPRKIIDAVHEAYHAIRVMA
ncbi:2-enoate reductase [Levilactobacillus zymae]|uniref:2-enoate reductase n=1 Tax=Levilactobacillus zymae TaxID=267363 RepID=A0ABQ0WZ30_9LACO|nr:FAD-dependent oxidoreductase [Levilactobacillus zymae]KRL12504.1 NADH flavin oxidoreductase NADH oxidase [Levilactobacillus zymae DSM 19395]GEO72898.1 2-enoate reductase [Levilactobacillus zymae]